MIECKYLEFCHDCPNFKAETIKKETLKGIVLTVPNFIVQCEHYSLCKKIGEMYEEKYGIERREL